MKPLKILVFVLLITGLTAAFPVSASAQSTGNDNSETAVDSMVSSNGEATFRILIKNDDSQAHKYSLFCGLLPKGMQADFNLNGSIIGELELKA